MPKVTLPFGEWRPDIAHLDSQFASEAKNVFAGANSYLPMPDLLAGTAISIGSGGNDSFTKVLLHFNGTDAATTITDDNTGGSAHTWTAAGNAQIDTDQSKFWGASLLCDGTGDWVTTSDHADFSLGTSNFSVDFWVRPSADGVQYNLCGQGDSTLAETTTSFYIFRFSTNKIFARVSNGTSFGELISTTSVVAGAWAHIEFTRSGNTIYLFINGTLEASAAFSGTVPNVTDDFRVGAAGEATTNALTGWIDEFRLSVGVARHTATFTVQSGQNFIGGACRGLYTSRHTTNREFVIFAGTSTSLLKWSGTDWTDVSRTTGGVYTLATGFRWNFRQFGTKLIATFGLLPQVIDIESGSNFAALTNAPNALFLGQIGDFLFLTGINNPRVLKWCGVNDIEQWTPGTNLSDEQEFPDGGIVLGVAGNEIGYVVQTAAIRSMQFLPGDTDRIFAFSRILKDKGCIARNGFISVGDTLFFLSEDGFYSLTGSQLSAIGANKVNSWFFDNSDPARRGYVTAIAFPDRTRVAWAFFNTSGSTEYDRLLVYDLVNQRFTYAAITVQMWGAVNENLDDTTDDNLLMGAVDSSGLLSTLNGSNLAATIETAEAHLVPGMRAFVNEAEPIVDVSSATVTVGERERLGDSVSWGSAVSMETNGTCPVLSSSRLHRFRLSTTAGSTWTHAQGVMVDPQPDGAA